MEYIIPTIQTLLVPTHILLMLFGVIMGIVFGAIPGLTATLGVALLLPVTFSMEPETGVILLMAVYVGGISGGFISAALIGIPGTPSSIATCYDAYPMSKRGESARALSLGAISSFIGTFFSVLIAATLCPVIASFAVKMGPWEFFSLCFCALTLIVSLSKGNLFKGLASACFGLFVASVGTSPIDATFRFAFGVPNLQGGLNLVALMLGLFAIGQIVDDYAHDSTQSELEDHKRSANDGIFLKDYTSNLANIIRSFIIGLWIGFLPGMGGGVSNLVAYAQAKSSSKDPEKFGMGCPDGIIASEVSNNAAVGGAIIPMIALGIPGDSVTAMLLGGLLIHGIEAGPLLLVNSASYVYVLFGALLFGAILTLVLQLLGMRTFPLILKIPYHYLFSAIAVICFVGAFSANNTIFNCGEMLVFTLFAVLLRCAGCPISPMILGFVLGPMIEKNLRRGLTYTENGFWEFLIRPVSAIFLFIAVFSVFWALFGHKFKKKA